MNTPVIVAASLGIAFICAYMLFKIGDRVKESPYNVHYALQIILYSMVVMGIFIAGSAAYNTGQVCSYEINSTFSNETTPTASETDTNTTYYYDLICEEDPVLAGKSLFSVVNWFLRLMFLYLFGFVVYSIYYHFKKHFNKNWKQ